MTSTGKHASNFPLHSSSFVTEDVDVTYEVATIADDLEHVDLVAPILKFENSEDDLATDDIFRDQGFEESIMSDFVAEYPFILDEDLFSPLDKLELDVLEKSATLFKKKPCDSADYVSNEVESSANNVPFKIHNDLQLTAANPNAKKKIVQSSAHDYGTRLSTGTIKKQLHRVAGKDTTNRQPRSRTQTCLSPKVQMVANLEKALTSPITKAVNTSARQTTEERLHDNDKRELKVPKGKAGKRAALKTMKQRSFKSTLLKVKNRITGRKRTKMPEAEQRRRNCELAKRSRLKKMQQLEHAIKRMQELEAENKVWRTKFADMREWGFNLMMHFSSHHPDCSCTNTSSQQKLKEILAPPIVNGSQLNIRLAQ